MKHTLLIFPLMAFSLACAAETPAAETPAADTTAPAAATPDAAAQAPAADAAKADKPAEETIADGNVARREGEDTAADATLRLREKLKQIDTKYAEITHPSNSLKYACTNVKNNAERKLPEIDKMALEVAALQEKFNKAGAADYAFEKVSYDDRNKFARDGEAAYKAMLVDMKEKKSKRKVGGIEKYELMTERYQGVPQYREANDWYKKTLKALEKKWTKWYDAEQAKRKRLTSDQASKYTKADDAEYEKLQAQLEEEGEKMAAVWYHPSQHNLRMLQECVRKVQDAAKRSTRTKLDDNVGTVPDLLDRYWQAMDEARKAMLNGDLDGADKILKEDASYKIIVKLKSQLLPNEYREPLVAQRSDMTKEIQKRQRENKSLKSDLERKTATMDRSIDGLEAQLNNVLSKIEAEHDQDSGDETAEIDNEEEKPAEQEGGKAPAEGEA